MQADLDLDWFQPSSSSLLSIKLILDTSWAKSFSGMELLFGSAGEIFVYLPKSSSWEHLRLICGFEGSTPCKERCLSMCLSAIKHFCLLFFDYGLFLTWCDIRLKSRRILSSFFNQSAFTPISMFSMSCHLRLSWTPFSVVPLINLTRWLTNISRKSPSQRAKR